jgi:predicted double-glycine peptidase
MPRTLFLLTLTTMLVLLGSPAFATTIFVSNEQGNTVTVVDSKLLKRAANQRTNFNAWAITGLKLSSSKPEEKTTNTAPEQP